MMVDRKCPTCISFAILGDEKSTNTFLREILGGATPLFKLRAREVITAELDTLILIKPLGITVVDWIKLLGDKCATMKAATSFGVPGPTIKGKNNHKIRRARKNHVSRDHLNI